MINNIWIFLIVHLVVSIIYTVVVYIKHSTLGICQGIIVFMIPGIGLMSYLIMDLLSFFDRDEAFFDQDELMIKIEKSNYKQKPNEDEEMNVVPIFEVLSINSNADKRRVLLDFLKVDHSNMEGFHEFMLESLHSGDAETTHYIASSLFEFSRERTKNLRKLRSNYEHNSEDVVVIQEYMNAIRDYIEHERLTEKNLQKYIQLYLEATEKLLVNYPKVMKEKELQHVVEVLIKSKNYKSALEWCQKFMKKFPMSEIPYVLKMDIYFRQKDNQKFTESLNYLMTSDIQLSNSTWKLVRHWSNR